ncbi:MAG: hypothetical protein AAGA85_23280 [Bacteroidota bacterium]
MKYYCLGAIALFLLSCSSTSESPGVPSRKTKVEIRGEQFHINGQPTYRGRRWNGHLIEGLLFNSRMVQGIFDDQNPRTQDRFKYPDTGVWDTDRNTNEFVAAMKSWRDHGMLGFTLNLQGGSPMGYGNKDWINTTFDTRGKMKPAFVARLRKILDQADELGMVVILGYFYFGQDQYLHGDDAVIAATENATQWILDQGYTNVIIEVANECDNGAYDQAIIKRDRVHELINLVKSIEKDGRRLLVSVSFNGGRLPSPNVVEVVDYVLLHGNGVKEPSRIMEMVQQTKAMEEYTPMPIVFNEDDHYGYEQDTSNLSAAVMSYASWGYFDFRREGEPFEEGYQSVPVDWAISSDRKREFFSKIKEITGY